MATPLHQRAKLVLHTGVFEHSCAHCLGALILLIVCLPVVESFGGGTLTEGVLLTIVLMAALLAVGGRRASLVWSAVLLAPALGTLWVNHALPGVLPPALPVALGIAFVGFVVGSMLRFVLRARVVDSEVLCAAIAVHLLLALLWAMAYRIVHELYPGSFAYNVAQDPTHPNPNRMTGFTALYFSFITLSTVGYGDITPISPVARMLAMTEATVGLFYITILVARLVSLYSPATAGNSSSTPPKPHA